MHEMPSMSGDTLDAKHGSDESASEMLAEAMEELKIKIDASEGEERARNVAELAALRRAANALHVTEGDRTKAIEWLEEQSQTVVNKDVFKAAIDRLRELQD